MPAPFDLKETDRLLSTTRAVRKRLDLKRPVERSVILDCIRLSMQAPTGSNSQSWRWMVVTDAAKRAELARIYREVGDQYLEMARNNVPAGDAQTRRVYDSAFWLKDHLHEVPVHVIPCVVGRLPAGAPVGMNASVFGSIFPAVWSFQLALRSRGLGSALDHAAPVPRAGSREAARHPRERHAGGAAAGRLHEGHRLQGHASAPRPRRSRRSTPGACDPWARSRCTPSATRTASR